MSPAPEPRLTNRDTKEEHAVQSTTTTISIPELRAAVSGRVITPDDSDYDSARAVKAGTVDESLAKAWIVSGGAAPELTVEDGMAIHGQPDVRAIIEEVLVKHASVLKLSEKSAA